MKETNEEIRKIKDYLMNRLEKLDDDTYMHENMKDEITRANASANAALTYIKAINLQLTLDKAKSKSKDSIKEMCDM